MHMRSLAVTENTILSQRAQHAHIYYLATTAMMMTMRRRRRRRRHRRVRQKELNM
jgi:hypothetical protein